MTCLGAPGGQLGAPGRQFCPILEPALRHSEAPGRPWSFNGAYLDLLGPIAPSNDLYIVYRDQNSSCIFYLFRLKRLGRLGQSQGDLISRQLDKKDPLVSFDFS